MKRLSLIAIAVVALLFPTSAAAGGWETTVEPAPGSFELTSDQCPNLPPGTTITGDGTGTSITRTRTEQGITTIVNSTIIPGKATDQAGNRYQFLYRNQFKVSNSEAQPGIFTGEMVDLFLLNGNGPAKLRNGFLARIRTDFDQLFEFESISDFGDPIDFDTGEGICDPL